MFKNQDAIKDRLHAQLLNLSDEQFTEFSRRAAKFLAVGSLTPARFRSCFFIMQEIIERDQAVVRQKLVGLTNPVLVKYGIEIIELFREGYGSRRIAAELEALHGHTARIGRSSIDRFLKANDISRETVSNRAV